MKEAQESLKRRLSHADVVEQQLSQRKSKDKISTLSVKNTPKIHLEHPHETTEIRNIKKQVDCTYKENSKYYKAFEDDLARISAGLHREFAEIDETRETLRKEVLEMREEMKEVSEGHVM